MISAEMIFRAERVLKGVVRETPILTSPFLDEIAGRKLFIKPECLQHTGSFKYRGAWNAIYCLQKFHGQSGVIAYSSGNHGQAVAAAANFFKVKAVIVMPSDAPLIKINNVKALGAKIRLYDRLSESREEIAKCIGENQDLSLVKPFDDPNVIAGAGTVGLEIADEMKRIGIEKADVLVCCGGGGLASGIALALNEVAGQLRVRTCEPFGFDDAAKSISNKKKVLNKTSKVSICDALLTPSLGDLTFPILSKLAGPGLTVNDSEVLFAMAQAFLRLKIVVEPGGAVALAAALFKKENIDSDVVVAVVTGGNVDSDLFQKALDLENA